MKLTSKPKKEAALSGGLFNVFDDRQRQTLPNAAKRPQRK
jgi:hypothetical protein